MKCGLLGRKLGHSYSPQIHANLGDYPYSLFEVEPNNIEDFLKNGDFTGINVTIPYKKTVIPYLDALSPVAKKLGAVNTVVRQKDGSLWGHNTDFFGFAAMVQKSGIEVQNKKALVLGSGGASNTAVAVLEELGAKVVIISRSGPDHYGNLDRHRDAVLIVNTTPVGMYPDTQNSPVDLDNFPALDGVLDVIYNPARTMLLQQAEKRGIVAVNGLYMLVAQAKEAAEHFAGCPIEDEIIQRIHANLSRQMENIILVGMPGAGKSTLGKEIAHALGRSFVDADERITELAQKSIPDIFAQEGEEAFRRWETAALAQLGKESSLVIATGGGCVTRERNYPLLHQNGTIFWIKRDMELLPTDGRPLSQSSKLDEMYRVRKPLYEAFADHIIQNEGSIEKTVTSILAQLEDTL